MSTGAPHPSLAPDATAPLSRRSGVPADPLTPRERRLWALLLSVLIALAVGLGVTAATQVSELAGSELVLPLGLVVLVALFVVYACWKAREVAALRRIIRAFESRSEQLPDVAEMEKIFGLMQRSQQGYRDLIDTVDEVIFSLSISGDLTAANRSFAELVGRPFSELIGRPLDDFIENIHGDRASAERALPALFDQRHWSGVLAARLKHTGAVRYFRSHIHVVVRDELAHGICVIARDITAEREKEARFTELFETLQEGVYLASADGRFQSTNPALARLLGCGRREDLIGRSLAEFVLQPDPSEPLAGAQSGVVRDQEVELRRLDGSRVFCLHEAAFVRDHQGRICRRHGTLVDITARREIEQRLHREQEFARRLVESFPDLVVTLDRESRCTFVSPRSAELLGLSPEEMLGMPFDQLMDPQDRQQLHALLEQILSGRCDHGTIEGLFERRDGQTYLFRASLSRLLDETGRIAGVVAAARDITETKKMEQQLIQSERLAAMGQMIAGVAHELNNPLTAVLGATELLRDSAADDSARRQLDIAHRQARRAAEIVRSLLSFARPPQPRKIRVNLGELIHRSLQLNEQSLRAHRIEVDFAVKRDLPAVLGDVSQLTQVFLNLITNAEQAIHEIRDYGTLRVRVAALGDRVIATFQDDGIGIRRDILPRLFDPFFTTKRPGRGTGLGLSICLAILREHNGDIEAQTLADGGSVFTVSLPVATSAEMVLAEPVTSGADVVPSAADWLSGTSVLLIDDERSIRELVHEGLGARGVRVDTAATAEDALSLLKSRAYDAVLCDLNLGGDGSTLSGAEIYARVTAERTDGSPGPGAGQPFFLFMTGQLLEETVLPEAAAGSRTLQKPFRMSELISALSDVLGAASQRQSSSRG